MRRIFPPTVRGEHHRALSLITVFSLLLSLGGCANTGVSDTPHSRDEARQRIELGWHESHTYRVGDYTIAVTKEDYMQYVTLTRQGVRLWSSTEEDILDFIPLWTLISQPMDLTGNGIDDLYLMAWTGGANCCSEHLLLELGDTARLLGRISDVRAPITLMRVDGPQPGWAVPVWDGSYVAVLESFRSDAPFPGILYRLTPSGFLPDPDLMHSADPAAPPAAVVHCRGVHPSTDPDRPDGFICPTDIDSLLRLLSDEPWYWYPPLLGETDRAAIRRAIRDNQWPEPILAHYLLDLIYAGHAAVAWRVLDALWPDNEARQRYEKRMHRGLRNSVACEALLAMNGSTLGWSDCALESMSPHSSFDAWSAPAFSGGSSPPSG